MVLYQVAFKLSNECEHLDATGRGGDRSSTFQELFIDDKRAIEASFNHKKEASIQASTYTTAYILRETTLP